MILYHYATASAGLFDVLRTQRNQLSLKGQGMRVAYPSYIDHVSFFLEPLPIKILADLYAKAHVTHPLWKNGQELYEYAVLIDQHHAKDFQYAFVEMPEKTDLYLDDSIGDDEYEIKMEQIIEKKGYVGKGVKDFVSAAHRITRELGAGHLERAYKKMLASSMPLENKAKQYAPLVPHVMLYDDNGVFQIHQRKKVTIGESIKISLESHLDLTPATPAWSRW